MCLRSHGFSVQNEVTKGRGKSTVSRGANVFALTVVLASVIGWFRAFSTDRNQRDPDHIELWQEAEKLRQGDDFLWP